MVKHNAGIAANVLESIGGSNLIDCVKEPEFAVK